MFRVLFPMNLRPAGLFAETARVAQAPLFKTLLEAVVLVGFMTSLLFWLDVMAAG